MPNLQFRNAQTCPLCRNSGTWLPKIKFFQCEQCRGLFRPVQHLPTPAAEKARYETHNNDVEDPGYQAFVAPIVSAVLKNFMPWHKGLDFGAGSGPVISKLLQEKHFNIVQYDPFFHNHPALLKDKYDYIVCCEVMEHFHNPDKEFQLLNRLLKKQGQLYCMTCLYSPKTKLGNWYYIKDPTHVFIYQPATMEWIRRHYGFAVCVIQERLITLGNA